MIKTFTKFSKDVFEATNGMLSTSDLTQVSGTDGQGYTGFLNKEAAASYIELIKAAKAEGITIVITDSYRDYERQVKVAKEKGLYRQGGLAAVPGTSNHGWGSALDLKLDSKALRWMQQNAARFGFTTIPNEPWHWEHKASRPFAKVAQQKSGSPAEVIIDSGLVSNLIKQLKDNNFSKDDLAKFKSLSKSILGSREKVSTPIDSSEFNKIAGRIIDTLEGGYYHPDMLKDGRVKDSRYGDSGETMMGIDRRAGGTINETPEGVAFWNLIDKAGARENWKWGYRGGNLESKLRELASLMIKNNYEKYSSKFLSPKALAIVNSNPKLLFNFAYSVWNGPGWFEKFSNVLNREVSSGNTDPESLAKIIVSARVNASNSLIAQGGRKIEDLLGTNVA